MTNNARVLNVTRGFTLKHKQAEKAVQNCACAWVVYGISIRDLSLAESITQRNLQANLREPLALAECHGLIYEPAVNAQAANRLQYKLAGEANRFAAEYVM